MLLGMSSFPLCYSPNFGNIALQVDSFASLSITEADKVGLGFCRDRNQQSGNLRSLPCGATPNRGGRNV